MSMCRYQPTSFFLLAYGPDTYNFLMSQSIAYLNLWNYILQFTWSHVPIQILFGLIEPKKITPHNGIARSTNGAMFFILQQ